MLRYYKKKSATKPGGQECDKEESTDTDTAAEDTRQCLLESDHQIATLKEQLAELTAELAQ